MNTEPQYAKYSLKELLEVQHHIDRENHPNRAAKVEAEIERRKQNGETIEDTEELWEEDEDEQYNGFIWDFQTPEQQNLRWLFLTSVVLVHIVTISYLWRQVSIPEYTELPQYLINVETARCHSRGNRDNRYYEFVIRSWGYNFYAVDIRKSLCRKLAKTISKNADVKIWHLDGIIFHLTLDDNVLISHQYMRSRYRDNRLSREDHWVAIALLFWALFFKSFVNAIKPGTFIKED